MKTIYDVIISGAGPVGLFLANELALAKCSVLILEKAESPSSLLKRIPFGIRGLSSPSVEALYRRGLLNELQLHKRIKSPHQNSGSGVNRQVGHFAGIPFHEGDIETAKWTYRLESSTPTNLISEMEEIETALIQRADSLGVTIKRGHPVTEIYQMEEGVTVKSGDEIFEAQWLVGCDGARSLVRKLGGFEFAGTEPEFTGYTTQVEIKDPEKLRSGRNVTANGMYMQSQPGYVIMQDFDGGAFHSSGEPITLEHVQAKLRSISETDVTLTALHIATTWTDRARQATSYRNGRILLAGDAAHIHSPLGGQGLNLGLGDAMNLGWKLAATLQKRAPDHLLETYHSERHLLGVQVLDWSRAQVAVMKGDPTARALNAIIRELMNTRDGSTFFAEKVWGISTHYNLGDGHPLLGRSCPNFEFEDGTTIGESLREGQGVLLDFGKHTALKELAPEFGSQLKYISATAKEQFGLSALLIRPDGYVAWVSQDAPSVDSLNQALARWFTRQL